MEPTKHTMHRPITTNSTVTRSGVMGMTVREYAAIQIASGICACGNTYGGQTNRLMLAADAVGQVDALLEELKRTEK